MLLLLCLGVDGCKSGPLSRYVSPRVTGRVVDMETHRPVPDVQVRRLTSNESYRPLDSPKGAEAAAHTPSALTGADGRFDLASVRRLAPLTRSAWYSVSLSFEHPGYQLFGTSYTWTDATNTAAGEPLVDAGDIPLAPLSK